MASRIARSSTGLADYYALRDAGYSSALLDVMCRSLASGIDPVGPAAAVAETETGLAPPSKLSTLCWSDVVASLGPPPTLDAPLPAHTRILPPTDSTDDDLWLAAFPPRTKQDLAIRRSRLADAISLHSRWADPRPILSILLRSDWDYISVCNVLYYNFFSHLSLPRPFFSMFHDLRSWHLPPPLWAQRAKQLSDFLKTHPVSGFQPELLCECAGFTGYRNPPYPGFDVVRESRDLAHVSSLPHETTSGSFASTAAFILRVPVPSVQYIPFSDWVVSGEWATAGASSAGRVEWETATSSGHFKARKNVATAVLDLPSLATAALDLPGQVNVAITKSELGKIRIAVSSDLETYLLQTWVTRLLGGCYTQWPGSTVEETPNEETNRALEILRLAATQIGLPFDYAGFDHQPTLDEVLVIVNLLLDMALTNVPATQLDDFGRVRAAIIRGFKNSVLLVRPPTPARFPVTGGVMSGLRWTSLIGNAWNTVVTTLAVRVVTTLMGSQPSVTRWIRGDDSAIFADTWSTVTAVKLGYDALGVLSSAGKFSALPHNMEFLRVWYRDRAYGYAPRALPGLTQRKPWTAEGWTPNGTWASLFEVLTTLRRRGLPSELTDAAWDYFVAVWSRKSRLPGWLLGCPRGLGGLGVGVWDGESYPDTPVPTPSPPPFRVLNSTGLLARRRASQILDLVSFTIPDASLADLDQSILRNLLQADDAPALTKELRLAYKASLLSYRPRRLRLRLFSPPREPLLSPATLQGLDALRDFASNLTLPTLYGRHAPLLPAWRAGQDATPYGFIPRTYFSLHHPDFWADLRALERLGWHRSFALDWLFASVSAAPLVVLPSVASSTVVTSTISTVDFRKMRNRSAVATLHRWSPYHERLLSQSPLAQSTMFH